MLRCSALGRLECLVPCDRYLWRVFLTAAVRIFNVHFSCSPSRRWLPDAFFNEPQEFDCFGSAYILALVVVSVLDLGRCIHKLNGRLEALGYGYLVLDADIP